MYTDDSDPLAAAIYSGWVQGSWGDGINKIILGLSKSDSRHKGKGTMVDVDKSQLSGATTLTSLPSTPMKLPMDRDLYLTCLVLLPLEKYTSKIRHGVKSYERGNNYNRISFRIEKVDWVDKKVGRGEGTTGEARRKRMKTLLEDGGGLGRGFANPVVTIGGPGGLPERGQDVLLVGA